MKQPRTKKQIPERDRRPVRVRSLFVSVFFAVLSVASVALSNGFQLTPVDKWGKGKIVIARHGKLVGGESEGPVLLTGDDRRGNGWTGIPVDEKGNPTSSDSNQTVVLNKDYNKYLVERSAITTNADQARMMIQSRPPAPTMERRSRDHRTGQGQDCRVEINPDDFKVTIHPLAGASESPAADGHSVPTAPPGGIIHGNGSDRFPASAGNSGRANGFPARGDVIDTLSSAAEISNRARGINLVEAATATRRIIESNARSDQNRLADAYRSMPIQQVSGFLSQAQKSLEDLASNLESTDASSLDRSDRARFRNLFLNAADKAKFGLGELEKERAESEALKQNSPFSNLLGGGAGSMSNSGRRALEDIFKQSEGDDQANTNDALVNRLLMFNGLSPEQQRAALSKINLKDRVKLKLKNGKQADFDLLHNGYIFGGSKTSLDCSSFVSSILPPDARKGRFTTMDFLAIWDYLISGKFPVPPVYEKKRAAALREAADAFLPLDLKLGAELAPGDLLVYRIDNDPAGHVFIVKKYYPDRMTADLIDMSQTAGSVVERSQFPLTLMPVSSGKRFLKPGLFALRLKPVSNKGCQYKDDQKREPAAAMPKGAAW